MRRTYEQRTGGRTSYFTFWREVHSDLNEFPRLFLAGSDKIFGAQITPPRTFAHRIFISVGRQGWQNTTYYCCSDGTLFDRTAIVIGLETRNIHS